MQGNSTPSGSNTPVNQSPGLKDLMSAGGQGGAPGMGGDQQGQIMQMLQMAQQGGMGQQRPRPSMDEMLAALHYFSEVNKAIKPILDNDKLGKSNVRPMVFDAAASLIGNRVLKLPEVMTVMKTFPESPGEQKAWLMKLYKSNEMASHIVMDDYAQSGDPINDMQGSKWSGDTHLDHMGTFSGKYSNG